MPISQQIVFICNECNFKEKRIIGDNRPDPNELKPCPKCKSSIRAEYENGEKFSLMFENLFTKK